MIYFNKYWKIFVGIILTTLLIYLVIWVTTKKPEMSELDKYKLDELNQGIELIIENQKKLDVKIEEYKQKLNKIDSTIAKVKNEKILITNIYKNKREEISKMNTSEIDKLFHKRYEY